MKIFITGATGKIGSRLVPRLLARHHTVHVLIRDETMAPPFRDLGARVVIGDLLHMTTLPNDTKESDAVVHLAAFFRGATEHEATAVNLGGTLALAQVALDAGIRRFVFASTNL